METMQKNIIEDLGVKPIISPEEEFEKRTEFLTETLENTGARGYVLGISGGQDSLLAGMIANNAVIKAREKCRQAEFQALLLPYGTQADREDALLACDVIEPDQIHDINIQQTVDAFTGTMLESTGRELVDFDKGNVKARVRMIAQYAIARESGLLVLGTDHAAEAVTGFFTKFGDGAADVLPLSGLNKRQGRQILKYLGVPSVFIEKQPTADLLDASPGQADETELGITYDQLDDYLEGKVIPAEVCQKIENRYLITAHKRTTPLSFV